MSDASQGPGWWLASDGKWYPPQTAPTGAPDIPPPGYGPPPASTTGYGPPPGYGYGTPGSFQPAPSTGMNGCLKAFLIGLAAVVVLGGISLVAIVFAARSAVKSVSDSYGADKATAARTCAGVSYPNRRELDHCADISSQVRDAGLTVTVTRLQRTADVNGSSTQCADVTFHNRSNTSKSYGFSQFDLAGPPTAAAASAPTSVGVGSFAQDGIAALGGTLGSGSLAPNADASGSVCFAAAGPAGTYVVAWTPGGISIDRGIWLFTLS